MSENGELRLYRPLDGDAYVQKYLACQHMWVDTDLDRIKAGFPYQVFTPEQIKERDVLIASTLRDVETRLSRVVCEMGDAIDSGEPI